MLIGENGSGKTAILDALSKSFRLFEDIFSNKVPAVEDYFVSSDIHNTENFGSVKIDTALSFFQLLFEESDTPSDEAELSREEYDAAEKQLKDEDLSWTFDLFRQSNKAELAASSINPLFEYTELFNIQMSVQAPVRLPIVVWYSCIRAATAFETEQGPVFSSFQSPLNAWEGALSEKSFDFQRFFSWFRQQYGKSVEAEIEERESRVFEAVKQAIFEIFPEEDYFSEFKFSWREREEGEIVLNKKGEPLKAAQLSAGEKTLFMLVADLARRLVIANPGSDEPLKEGSGIVMIDEVGLHLHPKWQQTVLSQLIKIFENMQFVITTAPPGKSENPQLKGAGKF